MTSLDIRTVIFTVLSIAALSSVGLFAFSHTHKKFMGFHCLAVGMATFAVGGLMLGFRDIWPDFITIVVANTAILSGNVLVYEGTRRFFRRTTRPSPISMALICVYLVPFVYFTYFRPSIDGRIFVFSAASMILSLLAAWEVVHHCRPRRNVAEFTTGFTFLLYSFSSLFRMVATFFEEPMTSFMEAGLIHVASIATFSFYMMGTVFGFVWMVSCRLVDELTELATYDPLTGILNRRGMDFLASRLFAERRREETVLATVLVDIDHFKRINDSFGHGVGDRILKEFARLIESSGRASDVIGRIGGEEFLLLLPKTTAEHAMMFAERLRAVVEGHEFSVDGGTVHVTASFGVSNHFPPDATLEKIMEPADKALYRSKHDGRNRVSLEAAP